jgi:hypothetical protein
MRITCTCGGDLVVDGQRLTCRVCVAHYCIRCGRQHVEGRRHFCPDHIRNRSRQAHKEPDTAAGHQATGPPALEGALCPTDSANVPPR